MTTTTVKYNWRQFWLNLIYTFLAPAMFCLYWNVFDVHSAVGLGTVGYFTALGVLLVGFTIVGAISYSFWNTRSVTAEIRKEKI